MDEREIETGLRLGARPVAEDRVLGPPPRDRRAAGICVLLVGFVFVVFGQTARFGFVNYDDNSYVYENQIVQRGLSVDGVSWALRYGGIGHWHPLTWVTHMLDYQLFGMWAGGHHLTNVLLHAIAAVLLFLTFARMTGALWRCAFVAAAWAIHPLRAESVAWISERKDVLSGVFFMLTLAAYTRYARRPAVGGYLLVALLFALGLLSKGMLVTLPCLLLLLDYWPLRRAGYSFPSLLKEKIPLLGLSAISCAATWLSPEKIDAAARLPLWLRIENCLDSYCVYLRQTIWPADLAVVYPNPTQAFPLWGLAGSFVLLCGVSVAAYALRKQRPALLAGWFWFLGMLVPVLGMAQISFCAHADRYTYLPQIGLLVAATWVTADWAGEIQFPRALLAGAAGLILCALGIAAWHQTSYWEGSAALWTHALGCSRANYVAETNLGLALAQTGNTEAAASHYREALRINPRYALAQYDLGVSLEAQGQTAEAMSRYREALRIDPACAEAYNNLGNALGGQGRIEEAMNCYTEALRIRPDYADAENNRGNVLFRKGRVADAIAAYGAALRINPADADAANNMGNALLQQGRMEEAIVSYRNALRVDSRCAEADFNLGVALERQGRIEEAISSYREALRVNPAYADAHNNLGNILLSQGKYAEAISQVEKAHELQPSNMILQTNLASMLVTVPQASLRDGARALRLAEQASQSAGGNDPHSLRVLAAACAETGAFPKAIEKAQEAMRLAEAQSDTPLADALRREIEIYRAGRRCVDVQ